MRILMVEPTGWGFLAHYSRALVSGLAAAGDELRLVSHRCDELAEWSLPCSRSSRLGGPTGDWWRLRREVLAFGPDLVHLHWIGSPRLARLFAAWLRWRGIPLVYTPQNILPHRRRQGCLRAFARLYRAFDGVIARDPHIAWSLRELFELDPRRIKLIPESPQLMALSPPAGAPVAARGEDELRLLFFGHGGSGKGLDLLLQALLRLPPNPGLRLILAGERITRGASAALLEALASHIPIERIERYLDGRETAELFRACDLLMLPYLKQCKTPLVELANDFGLPVVRSTSVDTTDFIEGCNGWTLPTGEPTALALWLRQTLADRRPLTRAGERLGTPLAQARLAACVARHRCFYRQLLGDRVVQRSGADDLVPANPQEIR